MINSQCELCGGCPLRVLPLEEYRTLKVSDFKKTISQIKNAKPIFDEPIFINDGLRRRAELDFVYEKKQLKLGFYQSKTHNIIDINNCPMLHQSLCGVLPDLRRFLSDLCSIVIAIKNKKKIISSTITKGSVRILKADNGIDIMLIVSNQASVEYRMLISEFVNMKPQIIRFSWQYNAELPETIVEKISPMLYISNYSINIPQGAFLQASKEAENSMINKMLEYVGNESGRIVDLFCGLGTFTYPLAKNPKNNILSVDSSSLSLDGLRKAISQNQIHNVEVLNRNLFKYPLDQQELKGAKILVIDPPRASAHEQCREIAKIPHKDLPQKIVFVSCNPQTFVYDADTLISSGYELSRVTLVDQFVYSNHQELIALFTLNPNKE